MKTIYCCIFANGTVYNARTIQEAVAIAGVDYIVKKEMVYEYMAGTNRYMQFKYTPVNSDGSNRDVVIGHFQLLSISADETTANRTKRDFLIKNLNNDDVHLYSNTCWGIEFFIDKLLPLMKRLNELGSYEIFQQSFKVERLEGEIENLKAENKRLTEKLQTQKI